MALVGRTARQTTGPLIGKEVTASEELDHFRSWPIADVAAACVLRPLASAALASPSIL